MNTRFRSSLHRVSEEGGVLGDEDSVVLVFSAEEMEGESMAALSATGEAVCSVLED